MTQTIATKIPNRHGLNIAVLIEIPENPKELIFIVHGWKSSKNGSIPPHLAAEALAHQMIAVRFDCTHSAGESDGSIEKSTISTFIDDLDDVVQWAKTQEWFEAPYFLAGSSLGGIAALEHANRYKEDIKALALVAPVISGKFTLEAYMRFDPDRTEKWRSTGFQEMDYTGGRAVFPWSHVEDRLKYDALLYASELMMPVIICVGSEDKSCPADQQSKLFEALGTSTKELNIIDGAPHVLAVPAHVAALKAYFGSWLVKFL